MMKVRLFFSLFFAALGCQKNTAPPTPDWSSVTHSAVFSAGKKVGIVQGNFVKELSGIAPSRRTPGAFWVHGDGKINEIHLIDSLGNHLATLPLPQNVQILDCEDLETGEIGGLPFIFLADIGDNNGDHDAHQILKIPEPAIPNEPRPVPLDTPTGIEIFTFKYATADRPNAECLLFDPATGDFFIVTKGNEAVVYIFPKIKQTKGATAVLEKIGSLPIVKITGGDISADGQEILIKSKTEVFYWKKSPGAAVSAILRDSLPQRVPYETEVQGEAVCFSLSASGFFTSTERATALEQAIWFYPKR